MDNLLLLCATGPASPDKLKRLTRRILDTGCNVDESRLAVLGRHTTLTCQLSGTWDVLAKLESVLSRIEREGDWQFLSQRGEARRTEGRYLAYAVEVIAVNRPAILHHLVRFFAERAVRLESWSTSRYSAHQTGADMLNAQLAVSIPADTQIAALREEFMELCDGLNLDAVMEPIRT